MNSPGNSERLYFPALDGLRLFASINIVLFHLQYAGAFSALKKTGYLQTLISGPTFHASLFFILGGFVMGIRFRQKNMALNSFLLSRLRDLYPLHLISTLIMFVIILWPWFNSPQFPYTKALHSLGMHLSLLWALWPFNTYSLNTPSWALSAFFFCYLFFFPLNTWLRSKSQALIITLLLLSFTPALIWGFLYCTEPFDGQRYHFFHTFAPIRAFEFISGILLARLWVLKQNTNPSPWEFWLAPFMLAGMALNLAFKNESHPIHSWLAYHFVMLPLYGGLIWSLARSSGVFTRFFSFGLLSGLGKSSFYPYLLHVPLASLVQITGRYLGYPNPLSSLYAGLAFIVVLYGGSYLYFRRQYPHKIRNHSK
jgi:peptidoglycan/LPS O-acetylase OafA/YrhL